MIGAIATVVGIDVGGERKGFHAVALQNGTFVATLAHSDPAVIVSWCRQLKAVVVAVAAPCGWRAGGARATAANLLSALAAELTASSANGAAPSQPGATPQVKCRKHNEG